MGSVTPSPQFIASILAGLAYWQEQTRELGDQGMRELYEDRQNLHRAVETGLYLPEAWPVVAEVCLQTIPFVRRRMLWPEWVPILEQLLARCPGEELRRKFELQIGLGRLYDLGLRLQAALDVYQQAETTAQELADKNALGRVNYYLAWTYMSMREYDSAERYARAVLETLEDASNAEPWLIAEAHRLLGRIAQGRGELEKAESWLRQAVTLRRAIGRPVELARSLYDLAIILQQCQRYEAAAGCYEEAAELLAPTSDELDKITVQLSIGALYFAQGDWTAAESAFRAVDTAWLRRSADSYRQAMVATNLGNALLKQSRWAEAEVYIRRAVQLWERLNDQVELANAVGALGEVLAGQKDAAAAIARFDQAIAILRQHPNDAKARRLLASFEGEKAKLGDDETVGA